MRDAQALVDAAAERAGSRDLGADTWRDGLAVLLESARAEADLNELGVAVLTDLVVGWLANRIDVERWHADHPEIAQQDVGAPLFGLGLPRTGSTALSFLLAADPARRSLRTWEAQQPCPPPEAATEHDDPRIPATQAGIDVQRELFPEFVGMLPTSATGPQECLVVLAFDCRSMLPAGMMHLPGYTSWLLHAADMVTAYRYHRRVLQLLQWRCPPTRWWLKSPSHMLSIDALARVYPDARFVMTHRDIRAVIPSLVALMSALSRPLARRHDPRRIAAHVVDVWEEGLRRLVAFRDAGNEHRFFDVEFGELRDDPMPTIRRLYEWLGEELSPEAARRMAAWWRENAKDRHGASPTGSEDHAVDPGELGERFAFYHERFVAGGGRITR